MIVGVVVAVAVPLLFLALVRWLDLYSSGSFKGVLICFGWGLLSMWLALQVNSYLMTIVGYDLVVTRTGPVVEEILRSLILIYYVRRTDFTYFVDGAIYGFAAGTAFSVAENIFYLGQTVGDAGPLVAASRAFSTSLMHGSATALVGISLGRLRFGRGPSRILSLFLGWAAAMTLHLFFNNWLMQDAGILTLGGAVLAGFAGLGMIAAFMFWGLSQERGWLHETLGLKVGVSSQESAVVQKLDNIDPLIAPVAERFGEDKCKQVETLLHMQAKLGLKRKAREMTHDKHLAAKLEAEEKALRGEMEGIRRNLGIYCMTYVRSILPAETEPLWHELGGALQKRAEAGAPAHSIWSTVGEEIQAEESNPHHMPVIPLQ